MKIETKPSIWHITLSHGCYSDYSEYHYFVHANSRDEAVLLFKKFATEKPKEIASGYEFYYGLVFEDGERYVYQQPKEKDEVIDWETDYGQAYNIVVEMLKVIYA